MDVWRLSCHNEISGHRGRRALVPQHSSECSRELPYLSLLPLFFALFSLHAICAETSYSQGHTRFLQVPWKFGIGSRTLQKVLILVLLLDRWTFPFTPQHFLQTYSCCSIANILFPILFHTLFLCLCHSLKCSGFWIAMREQTELLWVILFLWKLSASHYFWGKIHSNLTVV